jgi:hypothetical protein
MEKMTPLGLHHIPGFFHLSKDRLHLYYYVLCRQVELASAAKHILALAPAQKPQGGTANATHQKH